MHYSYTHILKVKNKNVRSMKILKVVAVMQDGMHYSF